MSFGPGAGVVTRRRLAVSSRLRALVLLVLGIAGAVLRSRSHTRGRRPPGRRCMRSEPTALQQLVPFHVRYRDVVRQHPALVRVTRVRVHGERRPAPTRVRRSSALVRRAAPPSAAARDRDSRSWPLGRDNLRYWGALPAFGPFALVDPQGQGRRLTRYSWGWRGQIDDLARMPRIVERAVPGLRLDRSRIYAIGSSMGGQETLLLVARHPHLLAGAAALDSATEPRRPLPGLRADAGRPAPAAAGARRDRRHSGAGAAGVRRAQPDHVRPRRSPRRAFRSTSGGASVTGS